MKWSVLVLVAYLGFPFCLSLVRRIRPQEYLAIQSSCEKWFVIFINSWCWNSLLIDDFVFRLRSSMYNLEGVANIGVIDGVADAAFYNLFGYGENEFVQLIDPPCSNVALLRNPNVRNLLPYFDSQQITRELVSLVGIYEQDGCKLLRDFRFGFIPSTKPIPGCLVSVFGLNKQQPTQFNFLSNGISSLYGMPSFLDDYRSRYRPCSTIPWKPVDLYDVMTSCKYWIVVSVAQESDRPCVREIEKFAVYSKDKFEFGYTKGPSFGVWLFMENKFIPLLAMSDPTTCNVPAVFDIIKGNLLNFSPPSDPVCDNSASSSLYGVDAITVVNQKTLMGSWDNWIVLQSSPFLSSYPNTFNEFMNLFYQLKGSFRFGFMPNSRFGLWLYGSNKNWPYLITSDNNDFQSDRYLGMLLDLINGRGPYPVDVSPLGPYVGAPQNFQPQVSTPNQYYQAPGSWDLGNAPKVQLYGSRGPEVEDVNSNALIKKTPMEKTVVAPPREGSSCMDKVCDGSRGLEILPTPDDEASEEFIMEPILNLTSFPENLKAGLDKLFGNSKELVVRVSFPYPNRRKKTEQVNLKSDSERFLDVTLAPQSTSAILETTVNSVSPNSITDVGRSVDVTPDGQISTTIEPPVSLTTDVLNIQNTEGATVLPLSVVNGVSKSGARDVSETTPVTVSSSESQTETIVPMEEITTEPIIAKSMDVNSQSPPPETNVGPTEPSAYSAAITSEKSSTVEAVTAASVSTDGSVSTTTEISTSATEESSASNATEIVVTESSSVVSNGTAISESTDSGTQTTVAIEETTTMTPTTAESITEAAKSKTPHPRKIENMDVETVRKDCKFWVLISSSETQELNERYDECYNNLTSVMGNYKNVYKFGAVQTGEFFINLYLRNKSNPVVITSDYACDQEKIKSILDAHKAEIPGEFCKDREDGPKLLTSLEPVTTPPIRPTSTVAPDCSLQLVVRYPKKDAKKYQSCLRELSKVIKSKEANWQLKEEDQPAFGILLWTTTGIKPLMNLKLTDCNANAIETGINNVVATSTPMCAYVRG